MAYSEFLAQKVDDYLSHQGVEFDRRKMFGGLSFMVDGKMCIGVGDEQLMCRIGPEVYDQALARHGCEIMAFTGRPMKGFVYVSKEGHEKDQDFAFWLDLCLTYNPLAKKSKRKTKKEIILPNS